MRNLFTYVVAAIAAAFLGSAALAADSIVYNGTPNDGWFFGTGNNYTPANTAVLTTDSGNQLYLRMHQTFQVAPASDGSGVYSFALGTTPISFDWGLDSSFGAFNPLTTLITVKNIGTGQTVSYNPFFPLNDNANANGSAQNSARLNFGFLLGSGFTPNVDSTYLVNLAATDQNGMHSLNVYAKLGAGAVPEPSTWAMMLLGFGGLGAAMRSRRRAKVVLA